MFRLSLLIALLSALSLPTWAQVSSAELSGIVLDSTGAAIAGAKVTATNAGTNVAHDAVSDSTGNYVITLLPPGDYVVTVEATGFKKLVQKGLSLQINQQAQLNLTLQVGQVPKQSKSRHAAPLLESESSSLGTVVSEKLVNQLPLNGRNFIQLAALSPGVNGVGFSATGTIMSGTRPDDRRPGTEIFSNGNREGSNNFLYDGIDDNERLTLSIVLRPAVEAVREFKIQTNLYSADIGRNSGAVVDVITKSGTNQLHGSLFEFLRNSAMDARNFFSPKGTAFPSFRLNQFGGSFGGPVMIPKLYNGKDRPSSSSTTKAIAATRSSLPGQYVPTCKMRTGDFQRNRRHLRSADHRAAGTGFIRDPFPATSFRPKPLGSESAKMINAYPTPTSPAVSTTISQPGAEPELESGRRPRGSSDLRRRTTSSPASPFRTPKRTFPARYPPVPHSRHLEARQPG